MFQLRICVLFVIFVLIFHCDGQTYDFAAEISRQCLVPDPVGLLDCVENKVTLPYITSWVDCTNSLGQNVKTSTDIINYRCKSVWEGKGVIPEVFYIKDCVIEKTGLPAKNVSAEVLGAYKECESGAPNPQQQRTKTAPIEKQQLRVSSVEYKPVTQIQAPTVQQLQQPVPVTRPSQSPSFIPQQQFQAPIASPVQPQLPVNIQRPVQQIFQSRIPSPVQQQYQVPTSRPMQQQLQVSPPSPVQQQYQAPAPRPVQQQYQVPAPRPVQQQYQAPAPRPVQQQHQAPAPRPVQQQYQAPAPRPVQQQYQAPVLRPIQQQFQASRPVQLLPIINQAPIQQQFLAPASQQFQTQSRSAQPQVRSQQAPIRTLSAQQMQVRPIQLIQPQVPVTFNQQNPSATARGQYQTTIARTQYPSTMPGAAIQRQPYSQQYFAIYPQTPLSNQQYSVSQPIITQKTATNPSYLSQKQVDARNLNTANAIPNAPYMYSFQINHPQRPAF